jgi:hypothetical protein
MNGFELSQITPVWIKSGIVKHVALAQSFKPVAACFNRIGEPTICSTGMYIYAGPDSMSSHPVQPLQKCAAIETALRALLAVRIASSQMRRDSGVDRKRRILPATAFRATSGEHIQICRSIV